METQLYIGIMSGTSMDGADAVLVRMDGGKWLGAEGHAFTPYPDRLRRKLLDLQDTGTDELHRSRMLSQELSRLYAQTAAELLCSQNLAPCDITALGCHGQTVRHAPEHGYSIQLADLPLLAELTRIFTVGDFRSRDLAAGGQGAPLVPAFHEALFRDDRETRVVLNIGGIANISVLPPGAPAFGFDTGPGNMLMDAWTQAHWQLPYDKNGAKAAQGNILPQLLGRLLAHPYFSQPHPKSTGRELFALNWLETYL
ncbi:TPA: anhydro-N-acetylmuramic acid kinase, partial [Neisseria gonorrhoeae]